MTWRWPRIGVVVDCTDPRRMSEFWSAVLGLDEVDAQGPYCVLASPDGREPRVLLQRVDEPRTGKNRLHLDVHVDDLAAEAVRVEALGAVRIDREPMDEFGSRWVRFLDPEGNEFCVVDVGRT